MSFLNDACSLHRLNTPEEIAGFTCGDKDLDDFFTNDSFAYANQLLGKTYCFRLDEDPATVVCTFTLANAGIRVSDLPNARRKKIEAHIPHVKALKDYPAVLVDAYNNAATLAFYESNGFQTVFSTEEQEKAYRHINEEVRLNTRLMYYDLMLDVTFR